MYIPRIERDHRDYYVCPICKDFFVSYGDDLEPMKIHLINIHKCISTEENNKKKEK